MKEIGPPGTKRGRPCCCDVVYRLSRLACVASRCFVRLRILLLCLDIYPPLSCASGVIGAGASG